MKLRFAGALALFVVVACSSKDDPKPAVDAGASSSSGDAGGSGPCGSKPDRETCSQCCVDAFPKEADVFRSYIFKCYCQPGADFCKEICKDTFCGTVSPVVPEGDPCETCLAEKDAFCGADANEKCKADPACAAEIKCLDDSACLGKP